MSAAPRRALSFRRSALQVAGRNGHAASSRIMPAVGDQAQARTTSPDKDDDWIKVDQYVAGLNPNILQEANTALKREKWRGEGVQQAVFAQPCVQAVGSVTVSCSSAPMAARVQRLLAALCGGGGDAGFQCGGLQLKVKLMGQDWFRSLRSIRKPPECARFEAVEFVSAADSVGGLQKACAEREIACAQDGEDACSLSPTPGKSAGLFQQVGLALSSTIEALPPKFAVRLASAAPTPLPATPSPGDNPLQIRVREIVIGAEWGEHGAYERMLDRIAGSASRLSLGLWQLPGGPAIRLIPTDVSGIKAAVLHVSDAERAAQVLQSAGFAPQSFPGYVAVPTGGLDVRLSEEESVDTYFSEVRWEVEDEGQLKSNNEGVSCIGAITQGVVQSATSGVMAKKGVSFQKMP